MVFKSASHFFSFFRLDKEKNSLRAEIDDLAGNIDYVQKGKVCLGIYRKQASYSLFESLKDGLFS